MLGCNCLQPPPSAAAAQVLQRVPTGHHAGCKGEEQDGQRAEHGCRCLCPVAPATQREAHLRPQQLVAAALDGGAARLAVWTRLLQQLGCIVEVRWVAGVGEDGKLSPTAFLTWQL